jgi:hypothetical protein
MTAGAEVVTSRAEVKGDALELLTAAYFQIHGFLVRRGVKLSVEAGDATDIDLLAIRFSEPLRQERLIADCKDRKRSRPYERVLWTLGLTSFARANRAVVVTPHPATYAREFAVRGNVEMVSAEQIEQFVASSSATPFSDADPRLTARFDAASSSKSALTKEINRQRDRLRQLLVSGNPITNLNRAIGTVKALRQHRGVSHPEEKWLVDYTCRDAAVVCAVQLLRFAEEVKWTPEKDWQTNLRNRLTYGDVPRAKAIELANVALKRDFQDGLPVPQYADEIAAVVKAILKKPAAALNLALILDELLLGSSFEYEASPSGAGGLKESLGDEKVGLAQRLISALDYAAELPHAFGTLGTPSDEK